MPANIFNEGRVVGYSAYEVYVRHVLSENIDDTPASEIEWLSSSIAMGSSMLLKIPADIPDVQTGQVVSGHHTITVPLPASSNLAAANTIIGSLFLGEAEVDSDGWATKVTDYGPLIENSATNPTDGVHTDYTTIPPVSYTTPLSSRHQAILHNYIKLVDGIVVQPGTWTTNPQDKQPPHKDFIPDLGGRPFVKIYVSDTITADFYLLLTGFTLRGVLKGVSGLEGSTDTDTNYHANGGFLGPAVFPWASKIVFSLPPAYVNYYNRYVRAIKNKQSGTAAESFQPEIDVRAVPIIDMESTDPADYYTSGEGQAFVAFQGLKSRPTDWSSKYKSYFTQSGSNYIAVTGNSAPNASGSWPTDKYFKRVMPSIGLDIIDANITEGERVLTIYQRNDLLPPALYATKVGSTGETSLYPVDTVAPGTVKLFEDDTEGTEAKNLEDEIPGNTAFIRNKRDYVLRELDESQNIVPVAEVSSVDLDNPLRFEDLTPPYFIAGGNTSRDGSSTPSGTPADLENDKSFAITLKRITGKLSSKIQELCGYEHDSTVFTTGIWSGSVKRLKNQIPLADQDKYYYIVNAKSAGGTPYVFPVRKSDHVIDVTIPYANGVYVNGSKWYPIFSNHSYDSSSTYPDSVYLGNYWWGTNLNSDGTLAGVPASGSTAVRAASTQGWAYIIGAEHPTRKTRLANVSGQVDNPTAILPADKDDLTFEEYYKQDKLSDLYTESYLTTASINSKYWNYSLDAFLKEALYTDMGTGLPLADNNPNRTQPLYICSNGTQSEDIHLVLSFLLFNSEETVGKTQYVSLPEDMVDESTSLIGTLTQTGKKQAITLPLTDRGAKLYNRKGDGGNNIIPHDGNVHWDDLVDALENNKSIEVLSALFSGFGIAIRRTTKMVDDKPIQGWEIINDKPYIGDGLGYTTLIRDTHFKSVGYNGFVGYESNSWDADTANAAPPITVRILPSSITRDYEYDDNGVTVTAQIPEYINISISVGGSGKTLGKALYRNNANYLAPINRRGFFVGDSAVYELLTSPPGDWSTSWTHYFTHAKPGGRHVYTRLPATGSAPSSNPWPLMYYRRTDETNESYVKLTTEPFDWSVNYKNYYVQYSDTSTTPPTIKYRSVTSNYPQNAPVAPTFSQGTYYKRVITWNREPGFNFYHQNNAYTEIGKYSWIFGMRFMDSTITLADGTTLDLKPVRKALEQGLYNFRSTSSGASGIWNIATGAESGSSIVKYTSARASWGAYTNMLKGFVPNITYTKLDTEPINWVDEYTSYFTKPNTAYDYYTPVTGDTPPLFEQDKYYQKEVNPNPTFFYHPEGEPIGPSDKSRDAHILAATISYADGYNDQFNAYDDTVKAIVGSSIDQRDWEGGRLLYANLLNMEVSCVIYLT